MPSGSISILSRVNQQDVPTDPGQTTCGTEACRAASDDDDIVVSFNCRSEGIASVGSLTKATKSRQDSEDSKESHLQMK